CDLFFEDLVLLRDLHSFPTRRSSDLDGVWEQHGIPHGQDGKETGFVFFLLFWLGIALGARLLCHVFTLSVLYSSWMNSSCKKMRSEEHTSELQSLAYLVCRLLLEKKK